MNTNNINEKKSQKIAIALFSTSLLCLALVVLMSGNIYVSKKRQDIPPQHTEWILSAENSEVTKLSSIGIVAPKQGDIRLFFEIEDRENIKVIHDSCDYNCNQTFDVSKLQSSINNKTLTVDFTNTVIKDNDVERVIIKLPTKDWNILCADKATTLSCKGIDSDKPINLTLTSNDDMVISGNFNQLSLWQVNYGYDIRGKINTINMYSPNASVDLRYTTVNRINIHSDAEKGDFWINDFSLLERTTLQPLTDAEREKIIQMTPLSVCGKCESDKHH